MINEQISDELLPAFSLSLIQDFKYKKLEIDKKLDEIVNKKIIKIEKDNKKFKDATIYFGNGHIGEKNNDPLAMYLADIFTIPVNLAGVPALSLPVDVIDGLPVGVQVIGKQFDEQSVLQVSKKIEDMMGFEKLKYS